MQLIIGVPIYERHKEHLRAITERIGALTLPDNWKKQVIFMVNNSSLQFVRTVRELCTGIGYKCINLGDIIEQRPMTLTYSDGVKKDYMMICRDNKAYIMAFVRNAILKQARALDADWLLFIDADSIFEPNTLIELMKIEPKFKDRLGVLSPLPVKLNTRFEMPDGRKYYTPSIYFKPENNPEGKTRQWLYDNIAELLYFTPDAVGFGFALIPKKIIQGFEFDPEKSSIATAKDRTYISEDFAFCLQLIEKEYKIVVHTRLEVEYAPTKSDEPIGICGVCYQMKRVYPHDAGIMRCKDCLES